MTIAPLTLECGVSWRSDAPTPIAACMCDWWSQIYVAKMRLEKRFEVLAIIEEGTQMHYVRAEDTREWVPKDTAAGPALQDSDGVEHCKPEGGAFPWSVAEKGAWATMQDCKASRVEDKQGIMRMIAEVDDPDCEPPAQHRRYDELNSSVRSLFRGSAMYIHANGGNVEEIARMLQETSQGIDYATNGGYTPAYAAAQNNHCEVIELLAKHGADLDKPKNTGDTPAYMAAENNHCEAIEVLAKHGADLNKPKNNGATPAYMAAQNGNCEVIKTLISLAADLNTPMIEGSHHSPLTIAAHQGHVEAYELLLANGADPSYKALAWDEEPFVTAGGTAEEIMQERSAIAQSGF